MESFTSARGFFVSNGQSKKFELIQKSHVSRSEKGYGDENGQKGRELLLSTHFSSKWHIKTFANIGPKGEAKTLLVLHCELGQDVPP